VVERTHLNQNKSSFKKLSFAVASVEHFQPVFLLGRLSSRPELLFFSLSQCPLQWSQRLPFPDPKPKGKCVILIGKEKKSQWGTDPQGGFRRRGSLQNLEGGNVFPQQNEEATDVLPLASLNIDWAPLNTYVDAEKAEPSSLSGNVVWENPPGWCLSPRK